MSKSRGYYFKMLSNDCPEFFLIHSALVTAVFSINELTWEDGTTLCFSHSTMLWNCSDGRWDSVTANKRVQGETSEGGRGKSVIHLGGSGGFELELTTEHKTWFPFGRVCVLTVVELNRSSAIILLEQKKNIATLRFRDC